MKLALNVLLILSCLGARAQLISGKLIDKETRLPLKYVLIASGSSNAFSSSKGQFSLKISIPFDTVRINYMGYKPFKLAVSKWGNFSRTIELEVAYRELGEVTIKASRNYRADSVALRQQYAREFNFSGPRLNEIFRSPSKYVPFAFVTIDVGSLIRAINKKHTPQYRLQQALLHDERENHVSARFTKTLVSSITRLQGDSLEIFMSTYRPAPAVLDKLSDYELVLYLKSNLAKYRNGSTKAGALPRLLMPGQSLE